MPAVRPLLLCLVAAGCRIEDIDLEDLSCPCGAGWTCDEDADVCVRRANEEAAGSIVFEDAFEGDLEPWSFVGDALEIEDGELVQPDTESDAALAYVPSIARADVRVVARMRWLRGEPGGAIELAFRIGPDEPGASYLCNWEPLSGRFLLMVSSANFTATAIRELTVDLEALDGYDPVSPVTLEVDAVADALHCRIHEIAEAELRAYDPVYEAGSFGLKTYHAAAAFDSIEVSVP